MEPVKSNITQTSKACTPISSNCVIWQGPDIPCLSLCSGDSVTEVVYKLGTMFCEIVESAFNVTDIDLTCLLADGEPVPASRDEFYQLIVDKLCLALGGETPPDPEAISFNLPTCLQYQDGDGNTILMLPLPEYVDLIGNAICDIQEAIAVINTDIDALDVRVTALENATPPSSTFTTVTTQCASGPTPGITLPIQQAFYNFENKFCQLSQVLGTVAQINAVIQTECTDLDTQATLMDADVQMQDLPGWVVSPTTLAENINNMWLTLCDMRSKIIDCCGAAVVPCAVIAPTNLTITNINTTSAMASWFVPAYGTGEAPIEYIVTVYNESAGNPSGAAIITQTVAHPTTFVNLNTAALVADKTYIVQVTAVYSCGESTAAQVASIVRTTAAAMCIYVSESNIASTTVTCDSAIYTVQNKRTTVRLQNSSTGVPVVNTGTAISVTVKYDVTDQCGVSTTASQVIVIPNGSSEGYFDYEYLTKALCVSTGSCGNVSKIISCVESIGGTTSTICVTGVQMCPST